MKKVSTGDSGGKVSFLVFHDSRGEIFHVHKHVSFSGRHAPDDEVEAEARALLEKIGRRRADARSLLVKDLELDPDKKYRVDIVRRTLVAC
jgi:hypothetical protein